MVRSVIFSPTLNAQHVARLGNNADGGLITSVARAYLANLTLGEILTYLAAMYAGLCRSDGVGKRPCLFIRQRQHIKCEPLGALFPNTGKRGKFINQVFKRRREKRHNLFSDTAKRYHSPRIAAMAAARSGLSKIALPATRTVQPASTARRAVSAFIPPSASSSHPGLMQSMYSRTFSIFSS